MKKYYDYGGLEGFTPMTGNEQTPEQAADQFINNFHPDGSNNENGDSLWDFDSMKKCFLAGVAFAHRWTPCLPETMPEMKLKPIPDNDSDFDSVYLHNGTPHCKKHGAMNKVSAYKENNGGYWRCVSAVARLSDNLCRSGCIQIGDINTTPSTEPGK